MSHPKLASIFNTDEKKVDWHDKALWFVRHKRDKSVHNVKGWEELRNQGHGIKAHTLSNLDNYLILKVAIFPNRLGIIFVSKFVF